MVVKSDKHKLSPEKEAQILESLRRMRTAADIEPEAPVLWVCFNPAGDFAVYPDGRVEGSRGRGRVSDNGIVWEEDQRGSSGQITQPLGPNIPLKRFAKMRK